MLKNLKHPSASVPCFNTQIMKQADMEQGVCCFPKLQLFVHVVTIQSLSSQFLCLCSCVSDLINWYRLELDAVSTEHHRRHLFLRVFTFSLFFTLYSYQHPVWGANSAYYKNWNYGFKGTKKSTNKFFKLTFNPYFYNKLKTF